MVIACETGGLHKILGTCTHALIGQQIALQLQAFTGRPLASLSEGRKEGADCASCASAFSLPSAHAPLVPCNTQNVATPANMQENRVRSCQLSPGSTSRLPASFRSTATDSSSPHPTSSCSIFRTPLATPFQPANFPPHSSSTRAYHQQHSPGHDATTYLLHLGLTQRQAELAFKRLPQARAASVESSLQPKVKFMLGLGLNHRELLRIIIKLPDFLDKSLEENLQPAVGTLSDLGFTKEQIAAMVQRTAVLWQMPPSALRSRFQFYTSLGASRSQVTHMFTRFPSLWSRSVAASSLPRRIEVLQTLITNKEEGTTLPILGDHATAEDHGSHQQEVELLKPYHHRQQTNAIVWGPTVLGVSPTPTAEGLEPNVQTLQQLGFGSQEMAAMVVSLPPLLQFDLRSTILRAKLGYLTSQVQGGMTKVPSITKSLGYSLAGRIGPRSYLLRWLRVTRPSLPTLLSLTDKRFVEQYGGLLLQRLEMHWSNEIEDDEFLMYYHQRADARSHEYGDEAAAAYAVFVQWWQQGPGKDSVERSKGEKSGVEQSEV